MALRKFKQLKMRTQILLIQLLIASLVLSILLVTQKLISKSLIYMLDQQSSFVIYNSHTLFDLTFNRIYQQLNHTQLLFLWLADKPIDYQYTYCPFQENMTDINQTYHCVYVEYQYYITNEEQYSDALQLLYVYDTWLFALHLDDIQKMQFLTSIKEPRLISIEPVDYYYPTFKIETRPYYYDQFNQTNDINIASPLFDFRTNLLNIMVTRVLKNKNQEQQYLIGILTDLYAYNDLLNLKNLKLIFCSLDGQVLGSNINQDLNKRSQNQPIYIYNQSYIDFDIQDWAQLTMNINNKAKGRSNCQQKYNTFCRRLNGTDVQLRGIKIQGKFLMILFNDLDFQRNQAMYLENQIQKLQYQNDIITTAFICLFSILVIISFFILTNIISPICNIIFNIENILKSQILGIFQFESQQLEQGYIFQQFQQSYEKLLVNHQKQKILKYELSNQQQVYPKKDFQFYFPNLDQIQDYKIKIRSQGSYRHYTININNQVQINQFMNINKRLQVMLKSLNLDNKFFKQQ
ncbi:hypothetical protein pb186bvf_007552 [Paramecium bursaria]